MDELADIVGCEIPALPLGACFKVKATWDRFLERMEKKAHKLEEDILVKGW